MEDLKEIETPKNGNTVLLTVIGVATLLVALVGATFAYFTATISNSQAQSVTVTTASPVSLVYTGNPLSLTNAIPGNSTSATFTVTNPGQSSVAQTYDLNLKIDNNTFNTTDGLDQLEIKVTGSGTVNQPSIIGGTYNVTDGTSTASAGKSFQIVNDQKIGIGETQTYNTTLNFKDTGAAQNNNQGKAFRAHIEISDPMSVQ